MPQILIKDEDIDLRDFNSAIESLKSIYNHYSDARSKGRIIPDSTLLFFKHQINYYEAIKNAHAEGKKFCVHSAMSPVEILDAFDVVPAHSSFYMGTIAQMNKKQQEYLDWSANFGYPWEVCQGHRPVVGGASKGRSLRPDFGLCTSNGCTNACFSVVGLSRMYGAPMFYLDMVDAGPTPRAIQYYADEMRRFITDLEKFLGRKMNWDTFMKSLVLEQKIAWVSGELLNLKKVSPCPVRHRTFTQQHSVGMFTPGREDTLKFFETVRDEAKKNVELKRTPIPTPEKYRIVTILMPPNHAHKLLDWMEEVHGIYSVAEPHMNYWPPNSELLVDLAHPIESLAEKYCMRNLSYAAPAAKIISECKRYIRDYNIDGAFFYANITCHNTSALTRWAKDTFMEAGIPVLVLDMDVVDPAYASQEELMDRIEAFIEVMDSYKKRRKNG